MFLITKSSIRLPSVGVSLSSCFQPKMDLSDEARFSGRQINVVTILDVAFDELTQLLLLDVAFEKDRRLFDVRGVPVVLDNVIWLVVVQIGARLQSQSAFMYCLIESFEQGCIGPCLIGRVTRFLQRPAKLGKNDAVLLC